MSGRTTSHSYQQRLRVPFSPNPCRQHLFSPLLSPCLPPSLPPFLPSFFPSFLLFLFLFLIVAILVGEVVSPCGFDWHPMMISDVAHFSSFLK